MVTRRTRKQRGGNPIEDIYAAIRDNKYDELERLLKLGINPNLTYGDGSTPLHIATQRSDHKAIEILLKNGADPNLRDVYGRTSLYYGRNNPWIVEDLIKYGAVIDNDITNFRPFMRKVYERERANQKIGELLKHAPELGVASKNIAQQMIIKLSPENEEYFIQRGYPNTKPNKPWYRGGKRKTRKARKTRKGK